jgi:histidinol phosphatase-like PHP family hydrolase
LRSTSTLFHLHTTLTDGKLTCADYFSFATENAVTLLVFLEHVRRDPTYSVADFAQEIARHSAEHGVPAALGLEAKILKDGHLDVTDEAIELARVIGIAEHGKELSCDERRRSFSDIVKTYPRRFPATLFVWVHPGLSWHRDNTLDLRMDDYEQMLHEAQDCGVLIERNLRYDLVSEALAPSGHIIGADAHNRGDLERWNRHRSVPHCNTSS